MTNTNNTQNLQEKQLNSLCQLMADNSGKNGCRETIKLTMAELEAWHAEQRKLDALRLTAFLATDSQLHSMMLNAYVSGDKTSCGIALAESVHRLEFKSLQAWLARCVIRMERRVKNGNKIGIG